MFSCDWQEAKSKFYRASNAILCKLGSNPPIDVCLKLIQFQCLPVLTYGMSAVSIAANDINKLTFAYNSVFCKLFKTNCKETIEYCQYFCNYWQFLNLLDFNRFCFLRKLYRSGDLCSKSPLDRNDIFDLSSLSVKYGLTLSDSVSCVKRKIWIYFQNQLGI